MYRSTGPCTDPVPQDNTFARRIVLGWKSGMNVNRNLGENRSNRQGRGAFRASPPPRVAASSLQISVPPGISSSARPRAGSSRITSHKSRITAFKTSPITPFLIDNRRLEIDVTPCECNKTHRSNRHCKRPFPFCTIATKLAKVLYSLPDLVCYSRRRTRVPPPGLRALAPARPTWCESLPLPGHGEFCVPAVSQCRRETSKLNGDFRARSYAN